MHGNHRISIVADDAIPFLKGIPEPVANVKYIRGADITAQHLAGSDALLVRTRTACNKSLLDGTGVSFIATATIGFDHIDTQYCRKNGIVWTSSPGCNSGSVMQYMIAALLHLCSKYGLEPERLTLGVVGAGNVGSKVAAAAGMLGMNVLINDPPRQRREGSRRFTTLKKLVKESDIITFHVPLNLKGRDATFHLAGREFIGEMKRGSFLFNTSRGGVTDEEEVKRALWSGQLRGYAADVWSREPSADNELVEMAEIATPHIAGYSADGKLNGTRMVLEALAGHFKLKVVLPMAEVLPVPANPIIKIDDFAGTIPEVLNRTIMATYDIAAESMRFKSDPEKFEEIRNNYPVRREFPAYTLEGDHPASIIAAGLGFLRK